MDLITVNRSFGICIIVYFEFVFFHRKLENGNGQDVNGIISGRGWTETAPPSTSDWKADTLRLYNPCWIMHIRMDNCSMHRKMGSHWRWKRWDYLSVTGDLSSLQNSKNHALNYSEIHQKFLIILLPIEHNMLHTCF